MNLVIGMDYFDSGPGFRNLSQTHLLKPSELTHKLPNDVVEASIPVLSCGITNGSTCADQKHMVTEPWASGCAFWSSGVGTRAQAWQRMNETRPDMECNLDEDTAAVECCNNLQLFVLMHNSVNLWILTA